MELARLAVLMLLQLLLLLLLQLLLLGCGGRGIAVVAVFDTVAAVVIAPTEDGRGDPLRGELGEFLKR